MRFRVVFEQPGETKKLQYFCKTEGQALALLERLLPDQPLKTQFCIYMQEERAIKSGMKGFSD